ncbi:SRPBCC family protein [Paraburkholderia antibiotica]|uniref:SRPBCC family protein n=1 Tax=Paraburkholderia antibiotica TaxID=2728839 RepID=A0A7Y0FG93_9BURK|nr:SRPBCC family protein [Paraburkholderia antibiotica]NML34789.1 SRPBCC family protein [Paraburkholderia antibiotica]
MTTGTTGTVKFHRVLRATPERIYRAFLEPDATAKWLPPYGFTCQVHHMEPRVGGTFKMSFRNFGSGNGHSFGGEYLELVPFEKIRYSDIFDDPNLPGQMQTTVSLRPVSCGTELNIVQEGIPAMIPVEMCYLGWQESLAQLAKLVEPEIPD